MMYDGVQDHGVPLPGSDPERRKQIRAQMYRLKEFLYLFYFHEQVFARRESVGDELTQKNVS